MTVLTINKPDNPLLPSCAEPMTGAAAGAASDAL